MTRATPALPDLKTQLRAAMLRAERRAYRAGWFYGALCGLLFGSMTTALALVLLYTAAGAWADAATQPLMSLPALTT